MKKIIKMKGVISKLFFLAIVCLPLLTIAAEPPDFNPYTTDKNINIDDFSLVRADVFGTMSRIINYALSFLGVIALVLIIYAGFIWMIARGNEEEITRAKETLKGAVIGLIIVLSSFAISYFVFTELVGIVTDNPAAYGTSATPAPTTTP